MTTTHLDGGRGWLTPDAAASIHRIDAALGHLLQITEAGRTWAQQMGNYQAWLDGDGAYALHPDTPSVHQLGNAIDTDEGAAILTLMQAHGWRRTALAHGEWWHFEYFPDLDRHKEETPMTPEQARWLKAIHDATFRGGNSMQDGKKSISQSLAEIHSKLAPIKRGGADISVRQEIADIKTMVGGLVLAVEAIEKRLAPAGE